MSKDDRAKLYPRCGKLHPDGLAALARADDYEQVKAVAEYYAEYSRLFEGAGNNPGDKTLEDKFFEYEVSSKNLHVKIENWLCFLSFNNMDYEKHDINFKFSNEYVKKNERIINNLKLNFDLSQGLNFQIRIFDLNLIFLIDKYSGPERIIKFEKPNHKEILINPVKSRRPKSVKINELPEIHLSINEKSPLKKIENNIHKREEYHLACKSCYEKIFIDGTTLKNLLPNKRNLSLCNYCEKPLFKNMTKNDVLDVHNSQKTLRKDIMKPLNFETIESHTENVLNEYYKRIMCSQEADLGLAEKPQNIRLDHYILSKIPYKKKHDSKKLDVIIAYLQILMLMNIIQYSKNIRRHILKWVNFGYIKVIPKDEYEFYNLNSEHIQDVFIDDFDFNIFETEDTVHLDVQDEAELVKMNLETVILDYNDKSTFTEELYSYFDPISSKCCCCVYTLCFGLIFLYFYFLILLTIYEPRINSSESSNYENKIKMRNGILWVFLILNLVVLIHIIHSIRVIIKEYKKISQKITILQFIKKNRWNRVLLIVILILGNIFLTAQAVHYYLTTAS